MGKRRDDPVAPASFDSRMPCQVPTCWTAASETLRALPGQSGFLLLCNSLSASARDRAGKQVRDRKTESCNSVSTLSKRQSKASNSSAPLQQRELFPLQPFQLQSIVNWRRGCTHLVAVMSSSAPHTSTGEKVGQALTRELWEQGLTEHEACGWSKMCPG